MFLQFMLGGTKKYKILNAFLVHHIPVQENAGMDAHDLDMTARRIKLRQWIDSHFPSVKAFADHHQLNPSEISQLLRSKSFGPRRARTLEQKLGMPHRYLENENSTSAPLPVRTVWPFEHSSYTDYVSLSPAKRRELDIRIGEFIAGAKRARPEKKKNRIFPP